MTRYRPYLEISLDTLEWEWWPWGCGSGPYQEISFGWGWFGFTAGVRVLRPGKDQD